VLTSYRRQKEGQVMMGNESMQAIGTHFLEYIERGTSQDYKIKHGSKGHSQTRDDIGRDMLE
jgi:hypothetical protein